MRKKMKEEIEVRGEIQKSVVFKPVRVLTYLVVCPLFFFSSLNASQVQKDKDESKEGYEERSHRITHPIVSPKKKKASPIDTALIQDKHYDQLKKLLEEGAVDPNLPTQSIGSSPPLCYAIEQGHTKIAYLLLKASDIDLNAKDKYGRNVLLCAALHGKIMMFDRLIVTYRCSLDAKDNDGYNALLCAALGGKIEMLDFLVSKYKYSLNAKGHDGKNALLCAASTDEIAMVNHLIQKYQCPLNSKDNKGYTFLDTVYDRMEKTTSFSTWKAWDSCWDLAIERGGKFNQKVSSLSSIPGKPKQPKR